jgi:hypothetical protein
MKKLRLRKFKNLLRDGKLKKKKFKVGEGVHITTQEAPKRECEKFTQKLVNKPGWPQQFHIRGCPKNEDSGEGEMSGRVPTRVHEGMSLICAVAQAWDPSLECSTWDVEAGG